MTHFSPYRTTPFIGLWFAEGEDGKLVIAPADACPWASVSRTGASDGWGIPT